jgi:DNA-binding NtrC family response regulator
MTIEVSHYTQPEPNETMHSDQDTVDSHFFYVDAGDGGVPPPLDVVERAYVARVLSHTSGKRLAAAHLLGISYPTFLKRLRELGFDRPAPRSSRNGT